MIIATPLVIMLNYGVFPRLIVSKTQEEVARANAIINTELDKGRDDDIEFHDPSVVAVIDREKTHERTTEAVMAIIDRSDEDRRLLRARRSTRTLSAPGGLHPSTGTRPLSTSLHKARSQRTLSVQDLHV